MTYPPGLPLIFVLLILLGLLIFLVEMRILTYAYRKVGVHPRYAFAVMVLSLLGSYVNIPLYTTPGPTVVALNVGGALIPILVSLYLMAHTGMLGRMLIGTAVVAAIVLNRAEVTLQTFVMASSVAVAVIVHVGRFRSRVRIMELRAGDARRELALQQALAEADEARRGLAIIVKFLSVVGSESTKPGAQARANEPRKE